MSFNISLLPETTEESELANTCHYGEIVLGDDVETFISQLGFWSPKDYEIQWRRGIHRLVSERRASCLIASIHDPDEIEVIHWWLLYPEGETVHIQDALLLLSRQETEFSVNDPYASIPPHRIIDDDGNQISEWIVPISHFKSFLMR